MSRFTHSIGVQPKSFQYDPNYSNYGASAAGTTSMGSSQMTDDQISRQFEEDRISKLRDDRAKVQKKAFTRWMNSQLKTRGKKPINDLYVDIRDGKALLELMSVLSNKNLQPNPGVLRVQKVENINRSLEVLEDEMGAKLINIGAVDIVDGNVIAILGMMWSCILHFQIQAAATGEGEIQDILGQMVDESIVPQQQGVQQDAPVGSSIRGRGGNSHLPPAKLKEAQKTEEAIRKWAETKCKKYGIPVDNFSSSWRDGRAFCALINSTCGDEALDMSKVHADSAFPGSNRENLEYAFGAAESLGMNINFFSLSCYISLLHNLVFA